MIFLLLLFISLFLSGIFFRLTSKVASLLYLEVASRDQNQERKEEEGDLELVSDSATFSDVLKCLES